MCEPSLRKIGGSLASDSRRGVAPRRLVDLDHRVALAALDRDRDDLLGQAALVGGLDRQLVRAQRPAVHVGPGQLELGGDLAGLLGHVLAAERVGEPVVDHRVDRLAVAHAEAEAGLLEHVGSLGHRLHAAADADLEVAGADRLIEHPGGADARGAHLVDRLRGDLLGDPGLDLRLARGDLALAGLEHLAHDDVLDSVGGDVGALERGLDRGAAEFGGVDGSEAAAELADRRTGGGEDHGLGHTRLLRCSVACGFILVGERRSRQVAGISNVLPRARRGEHRTSARHQRRHHRRRRVRGRGRGQRPARRRAGRSAAVGRGRRRLPAAGADSSRRPPRDPGRARRPVEFDGERARRVAALVQRRAREARGQTLCWEVPSPARSRDRRRRWWRARSCRPTATCATSRRPATSPRGCKR